MKNLNINVGDKIVAHDTFNIINDCVGIVHAITKGYPTKEDYENKTNHTFTYVCEFDRGTFLLKSNQIKGE